MKDFSEVRCSKCHQKPKRVYILDGKIFCSSCYKKILEMRKTGPPVKLKN